MSQRFPFGGFSACYAIVLPVVYLCNLVRLFLQKKFDYHRVHYNTVKKARIKYDLIAGAVLLCHILLLFFLVFFFSRRMITTTTSSRHLHHSSYHFIVSFIRSRSAYLIVVLLSSGGLRLLLCVVTGCAFTSITTSSSISS